MHFQQIEQINEAAEFFQRFDSFSLALHRSLRLEEVMGVIANDGRNLLNVDRVSVGIRAGKKCLLKAISGQDKVVLRSTTVKQLESLASEVIVTSEPLHYDRLAGDSVENETLAEYVTSSQARSILILPLNVAQQPLAELQDLKPNTSVGDNNIGCLIVEQFSDGELNPVLESRAQLVADHSANAIHNARTHHAVFLLPVLSKIGHFLRWFEGKKLWAAVAALTAIAMFVLACFLVPWEYRVSSKGVLMPTVRHEIFAPWDAYVAEILVTPGQSVATGDGLIQLKSDQLQAEFVAAETEVAEQSKLVASLTQQLEQSRTSGETATYLQLQGKLSKAEIELSGAKLQFDVWDKRLQSLLLTAPANGVITTFQLNELLADRPVRRGEDILQIADPTAAWQLELDIPEDRAGHVLRAMESATENIDVDFFLATNVEHKLAGTLDSVGTRVDDKEEVGGAVQCTVTLSPETLEKLSEKHIGAQVHAKLHCGKRSLGYVLFSDVIEFLARRFWL